MHLLLDIGNTSATYALAKNNRIGVLKSCLYNDIPKIVLKYTSSGISNDINIIFSSNVPKMIPILKKCFPKKHPAKIWVAGQNLPVKIRHKYNDISKLGIDRRVNIYGALHLYGKPALVIDFGTAITADYLSEKGVFEGGMIIPGPELAFQALIHRAARISTKSRLPRKAKGFIGQSTQDCMDSGILQGYGAMTHELIRRFRKRYGKNLQVIITGGFSTHLKPFISSKVIHDPKLSLKSLLLLYKNRGDKSMPASRLPYRII